MTHEYWLYVAIGASFVLGGLIFFKLGKSSGMKECLSLQQRMESTKMWAEILKNVTSKNAQKEEPNV